MNTYFAQQAVSLAIALESDGVTLSNPALVAYRLLDKDGAELIASTVLFVETDATTVQVEIDASVNTLATDEIRAYRMVELTVEHDGQTYIIHEDFIVEAMDALVVPTNSFQSYPDAMIRLADLTDIDSLIAADRRSRVTALINAFHNITTLRFNVGGWNYINLASLTAEQFSSLPARFLERLRLAQLVEANEALSRFSIHKKRQQGLMSETIGESSMMFRPEKILNVPVTRRSLDLLRGYVDWEIGLARG